MVETKSSEVPKTESNEEIISGIPMTPTEHKHKFVPLWMPIAAFALIVFAYIYCAFADIAVNPYRALGILGVSGIFALICAYFETK